jgi:hypothetical protein
MEIYIEIFYFSTAGGLWVMIEIYDLDPKEYEYYKKHTRRGKNSNFDTARKKFTAMIMNACEVKDMPGCKIYKFGNFNIAVRHGEKKVSLVYWSNRKLYVSPERAAKLRETYKLLGLKVDDEVIDENDEKEGVEEDQESSTVA